MFDDKQESGIDNEKILHQKLNIFYISFFVHMT